jgi:peptidoglycan/xylan/chitin deacetylase (PgdA/CDA1 family)
MTQFQTAIFVFLFCSCFFSAFGQGKPDNWILDHYGAVTRGDPAHKELAIVFVGNESTGEEILISNTLKKNGVKASFFLTGNFYTDPKNADFIKSLIDEGHYLGPHSDKHILYAPVNNRDSSIVSGDHFKHDLNNNYKYMAHFGIKKGDALFFIPPKVWYNKDIVNWTNDMGLHLVSFTPGTLSHLDNTHPEMNDNYKSSEEIYKSIVEYENTHPHGLKGFILLLHLGTDERRTDKFSRKLEELFVLLDHKGYSFVEINELLD